MLDKINQKYINIIIVVLLVAALGLGYMIYKDQGDSGSDASQPQQVSQSQRQGGGGDGQSQQRPSITPEDIEIDDMEEARQEVLITPGPDASEEERQRHFALAVKLAESSDTVNISDCSADPVVLQRTFGSTINLENNDNQSHTILFGPENSYTVEANDTRALDVNSTNFPNEAGLYGYGCDNSPQAVGLMLINPADQQ